MEHMCRSKGSLGPHRRRGPDSSRLHDPGMVCDKLNLKEGDVFVDLGCGAGRYSLAAAKRVGKQGYVYAVDRLSSCIEALMREAADTGFSQFQAVSADITDAIPINSETCDVCFVCTVLHSLNLIQCAGNLFCEIRRILKSDGRLFIVECKKIDASFGPPKAVRISPEELDELVGLFGFVNDGLTDLGHNYMVEYIKF